MELNDSEETEQKLAQLRGTYEPYVYALAQFLSWNYLRGLRTLLETPT